MKRFVAKYATFTGRASRAEYWWASLTTTLITFGLNIVVVLSGAAGITNAESNTLPGPWAVTAIIVLLTWNLAILMPTVALTIRRLHDANHRAWMVLIGVVPIFGALALIILMFQPANLKGQRFDKHPGNKPNRPSKPRATARLRKS